MFQVSSSKFQGNKGFTLIEILIVVAIIGLLASIVLVGLGSFRTRGRDARRIADLRETQNALELYYTKNQAYPSSASWTALETDLTGAGIGVSGIPNDPLASQSYSYGVSTNNQNYVLAATLEDSSNPALNEDSDGTVYGVNCGTAGSDTIYCVEF